MKNRKVVMVGVLKKIKTTSEKRKFAFDSPWLKKQEEESFYNSDTYNKLVGTRGNDIILNRGINASL